LNFVKLQQILAIVSDCYKG